ncbi:serine hydrolase domain-containing protein [Novosphingobium cyanobacteriorum]|uniref:Serine hydrolase n=1 Tax=Novosphingobium cyanobacteriorum TaxID=3024215 RepID=A0ABT6CIM5_9SPHN|nr:serine hydrolase domain-containing protein [Novosphingobium cyanobacteriorum]MDF8333761.1 serine hydrolase [Novosphingobium cyanobacteriorum]
MSNFPRFHAAVHSAAALSLAITAMPASADTVDDLVAAERARANVPGIAVGVIDHGVIRRLQGYGLSNIETATPVGPDTLFKTGALGMQFTAAGILLLAEDGKVALDDPVRKYLPELPATWAPVTIRHLLNHTSGIPATPSGDFQKEYTEAELLGIIAGQQLNFRPGAHWRFSYAGYIVLGFVIRRVTRDHYATFLQKRVFAPTGMARARGIDELAVIPGRASGYELRDGAWRNAERISATANSTADGSLYLSALDYAAWAQALSRGRLLSPASWLQVAQPAALADAARCGYGAGWYLEGEGGGHSWSHGGSWQGFQTFAVRYPAEDLTVVVLANGETADVSSLARRIVATQRPGLAGPATPMPDAPASLVAHVGTLLDGIAAGRVDRAHYVDFARVDLEEMVAQYAQLLAPLGARRELAVFGSGPGCGGVTWRLRARYDGGVVDIRLGQDAGGRVTSLDIVPLSAWDAPL